MEKYNYKKAKFIGKNSPFVWGFDEGKEYFYRYLENNRGVEIWFEGKKGCSLVTGLEPFNACFEKINKELNRYLELKNKIMANEKKVKEIVKSCMAWWEDADYTTKDIEDIMTNACQKIADWKDEQHKQELIRIYNFISPYLTPEANNDLKIIIGIC